MRILKDERGVADRQIFNLGNPANFVSVRDLATMLIEELSAFPAYWSRGAAAGVQIVSGLDYYGAGYEDVVHRRPRIANARRLGSSPQIDLREGQQFSADYSAVNPRCTVPVLQLDDGTVLCDAIAICWYLESRYPNKPLLGTEPLAQAQVLSWDAYIFTDAFLPVAEALRNRSQAFKDRAVTGPGRVPQIPELDARGRQRVQLFWQSLDRYLEGREYLVGNEITMADVDAFVVVDFAGWIKERVPESRSNVLAWYQRIKALLPVS